MHQTSRGYKDKWLVCKFSNLFQKCQCSRSFCSDIRTSLCCERFHSMELSQKKWASSWQNQQNGICAEQRLRSAWASARSDQSSLSAWRKLGSLAIHWAHSEDSDQTWRMPRLIWVFAERTSHFVGFVVLRLKSNWRTYCVIKFDLSFFEHHCLIAQDYFIFMVQYNDTAIVKQVKV